MFTIIIFIELICLVFSGYYLPKTAGWSKLFILFLLITVGVEVGGYTLYFVQHRQNHWLFNTYLPVEISFLWYVLYKLCKKYFATGLLLLVTLIVFFTIYSVESYQSGGKEYSEVANTFSSVVIIFISCLFYYFLMKEDGYINITQYSPFWIMSGMFIFYLGSIGCDLFEKPLKEMFIKTGIPIRYIIMIVLNFILYACWSYGFICRYRYKISSS